jgi:hypothetical protein
LPLFCGENIYKIIALVGSRFHLLPEQDVVLDERFDERHALLEVDDVAAGTLGQLYKIIFGCNLQTTLRKLQKIQSSELYV